MITKRKWDNINKYGEVLVYYNTPQVIVSLDHKIIATLIKDGKFIDKFIISENIDNLDINKFINGDIDLRSLYLVDRNRSISIIYDGCFLHHKRSLKIFNCKKLDEKDILEEYLPEHGFYL